MVEVEEKNRGDRGSGSGPSLVAEGAESLDAQGHRAEQGAAVSHLDGA